MHAATVALYKFGRQDFGNAAPKAEYGGTLTTSDGTEYRIIIEITGKRLEKTDKLPLLLGVCVEEVK